MMLRCKHSVGLYIFFFLGQGLLCGPGWPETLSIDQTDLEFTGILLLLPLMCWD